MHAHVALLAVLRVPITGPLTRPFNVRRIWTDRIKSVDNCGQQAPDHLTKRASALINHPHFDFTGKVLANCCNFRTLATPMAII